MHPPQAAVEALYKLHPTARLAWYGEDREEGDEELNKGEFALVELYDKRDARHAIYLPWEGRGPIFGRRWDTDRLTPLWLENFAKEEIFNSSFLLKIKRWLTPISRRIYDSAREHAREIDREVDEQVGEGADKLLSDARKDPHRPQAQAKKFLTDEDKDVLSGDRAARLRYEDSHMANVPEPVS